MPADIFFTSDTHWWHRSIISHCNRPWLSVEDMNRALIENWNLRIKKDDFVYHLGDFSFGNKNKQIAILEQLNGKKFLIRGNHDYFTRKEDFKKHFEWIRDYYELRLPIEGSKNTQTIVLSHYPLLTWNLANHGSWHLHGHDHGSLNYLDDETTRYDVGVDCNNYLPVTLEEIKTIMKSRTYKAVDHHG